MRHDGGEEAHAKSSIRQRGKSRRLMEKILNPGNHVGRTGRSLVIVVGYE